MFLLFYISVKINSNTAQCSCTTNGSLHQSHQQTQGFGAWTNEPSPVAAQQMGAHTSHTNRRRASVRCVDSKFISRNSRRGTQVHTKDPEGTKTNAKTNTNSRKLFSTLHIKKQNICNLTMKKKKHHSWRISGT